MFLFKNISTFQLISSCFSHTLLYRIGTALINITATDKDGLDELGGQITYTILSGDDLQQFSINPTTGLLSVNAELDYDVKQIYKLQVPDTPHVSTNNLSNPTHW